MGTFMPGTLKLKKNGELFRQEKPDFSDIDLTIRRAAVKKTAAELQFEERLRMVSMPEILTFIQKCLVPSFFPKNV